MNDHSINVVKSCEVIGKCVKNTDKENIGKIEEIVLDKVSGQVRYVVLSFDRYFGFGGKYFAFPWRSIDYSPEDECFILNISKDKLENDRGFDKDAWPDMAYWPETVADFYDKL